MEYGKILKRSIDIVWRHKILWVFGVVLAIFSGSRFPNGFQPNLQYSLGQSDLPRLQQLMPWWPQTLGQVSPSTWEGVAAAIMGIIVALMVFAVLWIIVALIARYTSLGAMIGMVDEVEREGATTFRSGLKQGWRRFLWLLAVEFLVNLVVAIVMFVLLLVAAAIIVVAVLVGRALVLQGHIGMGGGETLAIIAAVGVGLVFVVGLVLVALVLTLIVTVVREFAFRSIILDGRNVFQGIGEGLRLFRSRFRESLFTWLLLLAIDIGLSLVLIPVVLVGFAAIVLLVGGAYAATQAAVVPILLLIPLALLACVAMVLIRGVYGAFQSAVWTLAYRELRG
jgi:hypothetical protein